MFKPDILFQKHPSIHVSRYALPPRAEQPRAVAVRRTQLESAEVREELERRQVLVEVRRHLLRRPRNHPLRGARLHHR